MGSFPRSSAPSLVLGSWEKEPQDSAEPSYPLTPRPWSPNLTQHLSPGFSFLRDPRALLPHPPLRVCDLSQEGPCLCPQKAPSFLLRL